MGTSWTSPELDLASDISSAGAVGSPIAAAAALAFWLGPARAARWLAGDVAQELQELGLLAEGAGGNLANQLAGDGGTTAISPHPQP